MAIVWLASYPKSGNTWVRIFLSNYMSDKNEPIDINDLAGSWSHLERSMFDDVMGLSSSDMTEEELNYYRPLYQAVLAANGDKPKFIKSHEAYRLFPSGQSVFGPLQECKAIHLVRNPLDVAVSFAHHNNKSIDKTIQEMANPKAKMSGGPFRFLEMLDSWSNFNRSWIEQDEVPILTLRYEDMLDDARGCFAKIIHFTGLDYDEVRLDKALSFSSFDRLQAQEREKGFRERQPTAESFFRNAKAHDWLNVLTAEQIDKIEQDHSMVMARLGYR